MRRPRSSKTDQQNQLDETGATPSCCCFHKGHSLCHPGSSPELAPQEGTRVPSAPYCRPDGTRPRPASPKMSWEPENTDLSFFSLCPRLPRGSFHGRHVRVPSHGETALSGPVRSVFFFLSFGTIPEGTKFHCSFAWDNTPAYVTLLHFLDAYQIPVWIAGFRPGRAPFGPLCVSAWVSFWDFHGAVWAPLWEHILCASIGGCGGETTQERASSSLPRYGPADDPNRHTLYAYLCEAAA